MLALKEWVNHELISEHMRPGFLSNRPSKYDWRYYPKKWVISNICNNMFDQDALDWTMKKNKTRDSSIFRESMRQLKKSMRKLLPCKLHACNIHVITCQYTCPFRVQGFSLTLEQHDLNIFLQPLNWLNNQVWVNYGHLYMYKSFHSLAESFYFSLITHEYNISTQRKRTYTFIYPKLLKDGFSGVKH